MSQTEKPVDLPLHPRLGNDVLEMQEVLETGCEEKAEGHTSFLCTIPEPLKNFAYRSSGPLTSFNHNAYRKDTVKMQSSFRKLACVQRELKIQNRHIDSHWTLSRCSRILCVAAVCFALSLVLESTLDTDSQACRAM